MNTIKVRKYRNKPKIIEAIQWDGRGSDQILQFCRKQIQHRNGSTIQLVTPEGVMVVQPGSYIVKGIEGEFYPIKKEIFEKSYFEVLEDVENKKGQ